MPKTSETVLTDVTPTTAIAVRNVRKTFLLRHTHSLKESFVAKVRGKTIASTFDALKGVDFTVEAGESVALLGFNGSGKSTLLKLVSGVLRPDGGAIRTRGRIAGLIEVGAGFHPDLSGRENIYLNAAILGMTKEEIDARFDDIVTFSEIEKFIDTEVKHYSSGMFLRLAFSVAIHTEVDILLIDEILSVGDEPFQKKCLARIRELHEAGRTLVVVSHDLDMVAQLCDRGILLRGGEVLYDGPATEAVVQMRALYDVPNEHPYRREMTWMALKGITRGSGHGRFEPEAPVLREQMAAFLHRLAGEPRVADLPASSPFVDVLTEHVFYPAIVWLQRQGIVGEEHTFEPSKPLTREQMAVFLARYAEADLSDELGGDPFSDVPADHPAARAIAWVAEKDLTWTYEDEDGSRRFAPDEPVLREQVAVFLHRYAHRDTRA
ncbi:MAG: S-layer homology domain-containing protein [Aeromicrobium sp.]|uniref:ATP-binding cassette domain-containing protein n=1 Tax=Aeromicrobium sp. TaxID=1871063 RepID=UPI0039E5B145